MFLDGFRWPFRSACVFCGLSTKASRVCADCMELLPWNDRCCPQCGRALEVAQPPGIRCADCQQRPPEFSRARAPLLYTFPVDVALKKMKFNRQLAYAPAFAELLLPVIEADFRECDALVPVPLHRWRQARRGFNQADELCRWLGRPTALPVVLSTRRTRATPPQSGLTGAERLKNVRNAFSIRGATGARYPLIVDDVITTGATCNQLARVLLRAGAERVGVIAIAHAARRS